MAILGETVGEHLSGKVKLNTSLPAVRHREGHMGSGVMRVLSCHFRLTVDNLCSTIMCL